MMSTLTRTNRYFYSIAAAVVFLVAVFLLVESIQSRQVSGALTAYMGNLRDMIFMSTYDSLKKGNMKLFKSHLEEIGTFDDVKEFSLIDTKGLVHYSSDPQQVKKNDTYVIGLQRQSQVSENGFTTFYFPVETISYCSRCHPQWPLGGINSYYKLTLSRAALESLETGNIYNQGFILLGGGVFIAFLFVLLNLYERKKHEEQMRLSASVFENAVEAIAITTREGVVERINPAFTQITGYENEEILGHDIQLLSTGDVNHHVYLEMRGSLQERGSWTGELWNRRKDGENYPVQLSVTAIYDSKMRVANFVSIFYDISVKKAAERALLEMDKMKSEFISTAAHELRTPLSAIMGYTELIREPDRFGDFTKAQVDEFLKEIYDRGEALNQIIDDLLDVGRIESGKPIEINLESYCLVELLRRVVDFYRVNDARHGYLANLPEPSESTVCLIDRHRITQVLENLLNNASKYSPHDTDIVLHCTRKQDHWRISVVDSGIGMTTEQVERVFDKFYRADSSNTAVSGFGLGMSIAKQIVELHGGSIWVESLPRHGTTVTFTVPFKS